MNDESWAMKAEWLKARWPNLDLDPEAFRQDLTGHNEYDIHYAFQHVYQSGEKWPTASQFMARVLVERTERLAREKSERRQLKGTTGVITREQWLESEGYASWDEAVRAAHKQDVHGDVVRFSMNGQHYERPHSPTCGLCVVGVGT